MLEFTNNDIKKYLIGVLIFTVIYMLIYHKKGFRRDIIGYIGALKSCFFYSIVFIFFMVGIGLINIGVIERMYTVLLVPLGWLLLGYLIVKNRLKKDLNIGISIFKFSPDKEKLVKEILIRAIICIGFAFASCMILLVAIPDTENQPYGPVPIILVSIIFAGVALLMVKSICFKLVNKPNSQRLSKKTYGKNHNLEQ